MPTYQVSGYTRPEPISRVLGSVTLFPRIDDPDITLPLLISCRGIIHYTRSGERNIVRSLDDNVESGDFIYVAEGCQTGGDHAVSVPFGATDYVFIMGSGGFYNMAQEFFEHRPSTSVIPLESGRRSMDSIINILCTGSLITTPIGKVIILSHADEELLYFGLSNDSEEGMIYMDQLCSYVNGSTRPVITTRTIRNHSDTIINIRGCNVGSNVNGARFQRAIKQIFGDQVTVTAPKHIDTFGGFFRSDRRIIRVEYMLYDFRVQSTTQADNKSALITLFQGISASDIHGNQIGNTEWVDWIPDSIHPPIGFTGRRYIVPNRFSGVRIPLAIHHSQNINREYCYWRQNIYEYNLRNWRDSGTPPSDHNDRVSALRAQLESELVMQSDYPSGQCPYPVYTRYGFASFEEFMAPQNWIFAWNIRTRILSCTAVRHIYSVRIPITDNSPDHNLFVNAFEPGDSRAYIRNDIVETDNRFFNIV